MGALDSRVTEVVRFRSNTIPAMPRRPSARALKNNHWGSHHPTTGAFDLEANTRAGQSGTAIDSVYPAVYSGHAVTSATDSGRGR